MPEATPCAPPMAPPRAVTVIFHTADGDVEVNVDPDTIGGVSWSNEAVAGKCKYKPGHPPQGVHARHLSAPKDMKGNGGDEALVPPTCYWTGTEWICC